MIMKTLRYFLVLICLCGMLLVGCEPQNEPVVNTPPQEENPDGGGDEDNNGDEENGGKEDDNTGNEGGENGGSENGGNDEQDMSWMENPQPLPEATYELSGGLAASSYVSYQGGLRNDYLSFYDSNRDYALYIDLYTSESNTILPTGRYLLSDEMKNCAFREYCYLTLETNGELYRFTEGWVEVIADAEHSSGYPYHNIRAYFVMETGESVSLEYEGTIVLK